MSGKTNHSELLFENISNSDEFNPDRAVKDQRYHRCEDDIDLDTYETDLLNKYKEIKNIIKKDLSEEIPKFPKFDDGFNYEGIFLNKEDYDTLHSYGPDSFVYIEEIQNRSDRRNSFNKAYTKYYEKYQKLIREKSQEENIANFVKKRSNKSRVDDFDVSDSSDVSDDTDVDRYEANSNKRKRNNEFNWSTVEKSQVFPKELVEYQSNFRFNEIIEKQLLKTKDGKIVRITAVEKADEPYKAFDKTAYKVFYAEDLYDGESRVYKVNDFSDEKFKSHEFSRLKDFNPTAKELKSKIDEMNKLRKPSRNPLEEKEERYNKAVKGQITSSQFLEEVYQEQKKILDDLEKMRNEKSDSNQEIEENIQKQQERVQNVCNIIHMRNSLLAPPKPLVKEPSEDDIKNQEFEKRVLELKKNLKNKASAPQTTITLEEQRELIHFSESESSSDSDTDIM